MSRRRGQVRATRSSNEQAGTTYYCTGGAGKAKAEAEVAQTGLTWLADGGHGPVLTEAGDGPAIRRCPVCGLTRPVNYKARKLIAAAGITEVDISR